MPMSIRDANDYNTVIRYVLGMRDASGLDLVAEDDAWNAAVRLADRAHSVLGAGLTRREVAETWAAARPGPRGVRQHAAIEELIEASSLGTPEARAARETVTDEQAARAIAIADRHRKERQP